MEFQSVKRKIVSRKDSAGQKGPESETLTEWAEPNIRAKRKIPNTQKPGVLIITEREKWRKKSGIKRGREGKTERNRERSAFQSVRNEIEQDLMGE